MKKKIPIFSLFYIRSEIIYFVSFIFGSWHYYIIIVFFEAAVYKNW